MWLLELISENIFNNSVFLLRCLIIIIHNPDSDNNNNIEIAIKGHCSGKYKGMVSADRYNLNTTIKLLLEKKYQLFSGIRS